MANLDKKGQPLDCFVKFLDKKYINL